MCGTICQDRPYLSLSQPQTWAFGSPPSLKLLPVVVHFLLVLAAHLQRNRLRELEHRAAVQRRERLAIERELDDHHRPGRPAVDRVAGLAIAADLLDLRVLEDL